MANASQKCLHPKCGVKWGELKDGDAAALGEWMPSKGKALNMVGEPNFRAQKLEWRDVQGAVCKYNGPELMEEKERVLETMGHAARTPAFTKLVNQRHSFICVSHLQPQQYYVNKKNKRCLCHGANVRRDLEAALEHYSSTTTSHPAARAAAGGTAREQKLLQLHDEQAFRNAALQTELLQLKEAEALRQKEPASEAPASEAPTSAEVELAEVKAALLAAEERQLELQGVSARLRDELRQAKAAGKRRHPPPITSPPPFQFKSPVRPAEGWHHERLAATGDLSHLHSMSQHHSSSQPRTGRGVFSPPISMGSSPSPAATGSSPHPAIISIRRIWAAKEFMEFVDGRTALTPETLSGVEPQKPEQLTHADHVKRWHPQFSEAVDAVSHSEELVVLPSSTMESKVAKKSRDHRRKQAMKEHQRVETENAQMREHGELCVRERNLVSDQAHYNSGSMVATKATLVTALMREIRKVWLTPGDDVVTASENLAAPPGTIPKREARQLRSYYRDWRNHDCQGAAIL
jgi:hypothetical protein